MVAMRWVMGGVGLVSMAILARLLEPKDFGLIAMSMLFIGLLNILTSFGADTALIQRRDPTREHFDAAWTVRLLQTIGVAICVVIIAPFVADYFDEPRVTGLITFLALSIGIAGLENIGIVAFRKELKFHKEFWFQIAGKFGQVTITLILAVWWRNYWALAWGIVLGALVTVVLSYFLHPYRPRLSFAKIGEIWAFSQWMLLRNIGMYARRKIGAFAVGRLFSAPDMGVYSVSGELAALPTTELVWPAARALFPGYAKLAHDPKRLAHAYLNVLSAVAMLVLPAGTGLALVAEPVVLLVLGEKWVAAVEVMRWLALYSMVFTLSSGVQLVLMALGRMKRLVFIVWAQLLLAIPLIVAAAIYGDVVTIAQAQLVVAILLLPVPFYAITSLSLIAWSDILKAVWRPALASMFMAVIVSLIDSVGIDTRLVQLLVKVLCGILSFASLDYLLWRAVGQPNGAERALLELVSHGLAALKSRSRRAGMR